MIDILDLPEEIKRRVRYDLPWLSEGELDAEVATQLRGIVSQKVSQRISEVQKEADEQNPGFKSKIGQYV